MNSSSANAWEDSLEQFSGPRTSFVGARLTPPRAKPQPPGPYVRRSAASAIFLVALVSLAAFAAQSSVRRAFASHWTAGADLSAVANATQMDPLNPVARRRAAFLAAQTTGDPRDAAAGLARAVELAPLEYVPRLELAAALQASGNGSEAEAALLAAVELDPGYRPRWSLTNFYLRQGRLGDFWESARQTLLANPESTPMVLGLCWRAFGDSSLILEKAVPDSPEIYRRYFSYLLEQDRLEALNELWPKVAPVIETRDLPTASLFLDRLIFAQQAEAAVEVWNHLCRRSLLSHIPLHYPAGPYLTNGDFATRISGLGFDWKLPSAQGVFRVQRSTDFGSRALEVRLLGGQGDDELLLSQVAPLPPGQYVFRYEYATEGLPRASGLIWVARDNRSGDILAQSPAIEAAEDYWNALSFPIEAPEDLRFLRLELRYLHVEGTERRRGRYILRHATLSAVEEQGAAD